MIVQARIAAGIAAAAAIGGLLAACGGEAGQPVPATGAAPTSANASAPTSTAQQVALRFPNQNMTISMAGYDGTVKMVQFQLAKWVSGGPDDGHYGDDPSDTATHRLGIAPGAKLSALSPDCTGPAAGSDPNTDGTTCTVAQFAAALADGSAIGPAKVHVNANDQIDSAQELYHP
jgi:hypothetical protein